MAKIFLFLCLALMVCGGTAYSPVPVTLYFESFCPGCRDFITTTLKGAVSTIGKIMDVTLLPYGNARKGPDGSIQCQHGPKECTGNIWENCAIAQKPQFEDHWKFILCLEQAGLKLLNATETCARAAGMDYNLLATCAKGPEGQKLHEEAGKKTGTHGWVPWVIVDGKSIGQKFDDFVSIVCKAYEGPKPEACAEQPVTTRGFIRSCNQTHDRTW